MNEARVANFLLIGLFIVMLFAYVFAIQFATHISPTAVTTVSAFCG